MIADESGVMMPVDEKIIAIIATYAYVAKKTIKKERTRHVTVFEIRSKSTNFWHLSSKLEVMMRRIL